MPSVDRQASDLLRAMNHAGGFPLSLVCTEAGLLVACAGELRRSELAAVVASLFSDEFYRRIKRHLAPGGLLVQWLHLYEFDTRLAASVIKAMAANFDDYVVYNLDDVNLMLIAAESGRVPAPGSQMLQEPLMRAELRKAGVTAGIDERDLLQRVNQGVNRTLAYVEDERNYGQRDFWATAGETLARGRGDRERPALRSDDSQGVAT